MSQTNNGEFTLNKVVVSGKRYSVRFSSTGRVLAAEQVDKDGTTKKIDLVRQSNLAAKLGHAGSRHLLDQVA